MDDTEDDAGYPSKPHHPSSLRSKLRFRNAPPLADRRRNPKEEDEEVEDGEGDEESEDDEEDEEEPNHMDQAMEDADEGEEEEEDDDDGSGYHRAGAEEDSLERRRKRRKLDRFALGFEFAPRVVASTPPAAPPPASSRPSARHSPAEWSEESTFVLLDAWGDLYSQNGRKSLRSDEWMEVSKKVSQSSRTVRSEAQCKNRLDTLKKKYKKEKARMADSSSSSNKWVYFKKMETLMSSPSPPAAARQQPRLPCGFDSGEYVFMNSKVYLNRSNDLDEMRDSPGDSECEDDDDDDSDGLPPQRGNSRGTPQSSSFRMLADSIQKFGQIYEKIENSKKQQMAELERMRKEFHRDLEMQKRQILERAQAEIAKIRQEEGEEDGEEEDELEEVNNNDEEIDDSLDNASG